MANGDKVDGGGQQAGAADGAPPPAQPRVGNALTVAPSDGATPLDHGVQVPRLFQLVCLCTFSARDAIAYYLTVDAIKAITARLTEHLDAINATATKKFMYAVEWVYPGLHLSDLGPPDLLQPWDAIVYFVLTQRDSVVHRVTGLEVPDIAAGLTAAITTGSTTEVVVDIYVENNFPAEKIGNVVMHELMHLKLDKGQNIVGDIHVLNKVTGLHGISDATGVTESTPFTQAEKEMMAAHLFDPVKVYKEPT